MRLVVSALLAVAALGQSLGLVLVQDAVKAGGVCLDGSAPGYYFRAGTGAGANKWFVALHGGGWCYGHDRASDLAACLQRSRGELGTSRGWKPTMAPYADGIDNPNCTINPGFCTHNFAYVMYCDGTSFSGDLDQPVPVTVNGSTQHLYFRGRKILEEIIKDLLGKGMQHASLVTLGGHSAGGLATYLHADKIRDLLPANLRATFAAVPDAGFFVNNPNMHGARTWGNSIKRVFGFTNSSLSLNAHCRSEFASDQFECVFPQNFVKHVQTPLFPVQSMYDSYQISSIVNLPHKNPATYNETETRYFQQLRQSILATMTAAGLHAPTHKFGGIWTDACVAHSQTYYGNYYANKNWEVPAGSGTTIAWALGKWVNDRVTVAENALSDSRTPEGTPEGTPFGANPHVHVDAVVWPHNEPCKGSWDAGLVFECVQDLCV